MFSPCINSFERKVDRFFSHIKSTDSFSSIREKLINLMQENLIIVNVWLEAKFKGYVYLTKSTRKKMYEDVKAIVKKWEEHTAKNPINEEFVKSQIDAAGIEFPNGDNEKIKCLYSIMQFLRPGLYYNYIKTASFGKLLRDPDKEKLEGDCNQIVTLYIYLYSLKFPLDDLKIKLLPEHVCLHFRGIDVEATNGTFQKYKESTDVLSVTEIISTNLLDLADFREDLQVVSERMMVKSAQLAYAISSLKPLVAKNLNIAYRNLAVSALNSNDFKTAIFYLSQTDDKEALKNAYKNACIFYMNNNDFSKAGYYADQAGDSELKKNVKHNEGVYYFNNGSVDKALSIFVSLGDENMKKACYAKKYNELVKKVSGVKTLEDAKRYKSIYREMLSVAQKMGDSTLENSVRETLSKI